MPVAAVIGDSAAGDEAMNVRVVGPGVEDGKHADGAADESGGRGQAR
jgi:hypothetical protein